MPLKSNIRFGDTIQMHAQFFADEGYIFGEESTGFERVNLAAPKKALMEGMERVKKALAI